MARTDTLTNFLTDVATAIKTKKGDEAPIPASEFDTEITNLPSGNKNKIFPTSISFTDYIENTIDISMVDTSRMKSTYGMFSSCSNLTNLDLSNFNTSNVTNMQYMFSNSYKLAELNLSNFDTSKVTNMGGMFNSCSSLTSLDLSNFDTSKVTNMSSMFYRCNNLASLDLSNFDTSKVTNMGGMFSVCENLSNLKIKIMNCNCDVSYCPLSAESVSYILQNLGSGVSGKTLTLGATNLAKATQEDLDSATTKGWTVN